MSSFSRLYTFIRSQVKWLSDYFEVLISGVPTLLILDQNDLRQFHCSPQISDHHSWLSSCTTGRICCSQLFKTNPRRYLLERMSLDLFLEVVSISSWRQDWYVNWVLAFSSRRMVSELLTRQTHVSFGMYQIPMEQDGIAITYLAKWNSWRIEPSNYILIL